MPVYLYKFRRLRWLSTLLVVAMLACAACKTSSGKRTTDGADKMPPIKAQSDDAQRRFDEAMALLEEGQWQRAREAFRLVQAEFSDDPIADLAELYLARTLLRRVDLGASFGGKQTDNPPPEELDRAARLFAQLAASEAVDGRVRYGAQAYHALTIALSGSTDEALAALADYPSPSLGGAVLADDRLAVRVLLTESFFRAGRQADVLESAARLHELAAPDDASKEPALADELGGDERQEAPSAHDEQVDSALALARERAFEVSTDALEDVDLHDYLSADLSLLRAAAGWGVLTRSLDEGIDDEQRAALEDLFNRIAPDLVAVGAAERAAELSMRLAASGGPKRLTIGFLLPLSGSVAAIGHRAMAGALVAMRSFHHAGHPQVTLVFADSEADPEAAFRQLVEQDVLAVVGPLDVRRARRFAPLAEEAGVPLITLTTEPAGRAAHPEPDRSESGGAGLDGDEPERAEQRPFVFRNFIDAAAEARAAARIAFDEIGDRRAAVVYPDVGYGRATSEAFVEEFRQRGGQVVAEISYDRSRSDFEQVAKQLARSKPEAVFVPDSADKIAELTAFFAHENIWGLAADKRPPKRAKRQMVHYLGTSLWEHPILLRQAASYVEGATIPVWFSPSIPEAHVQQFVGRFEAVYGRRPENFEAFSYDTVNWLRALLLERGMGRPVAIRDALLAGDRHHGVTGLAQMNAQGEPVRALRFITPIDDGFEPLPFTVTAERPSSAADADGEAADGEAADDELDPAQPGPAPAESDDSPHQPTPSR
jgi:branched-chain amino acid transport system substrate-binding protein